jgi:hypothetical protein
LHDVLLPKNESIDESDLRTLPSCKPLHLPKLTVAGFPGVSLMTPFNRHHLGRSPGLTAGLVRAGELKDVAVTLGDVPAI